MFTKILLLHIDELSDKNIKFKKTVTFYRLYFYKVYIAQRCNKLQKKIYTYFEITHQYSVSLSKNYNVMLELVSNFSCYINGAEIENAIFFLNIR